MEKYVREVWAKLCGVSPEEIDPKFIAAIISTILGWEDQEK